MTGKCWQTCCLGVVQGVTEYLPVSSSAHVTALSYVMRWPAPGLALNAVLHLGSALSLGYYFRHTLADMALACNPFVAPAPLPTQHRQLAGQLLLSTLPAGMTGLLLEKPLSQHTRHPGYLIPGLVTGAVVLWQAASSPSQQDALSWKSAWWIGWGQALALIPGLSRSGMTLSCARFLGLNTTTALRFSFLSGLPLMAASGLFQLRHVLSPPRLPWSHLVGALASATVSSWLSLRWLTHHLSNRHLKGLALYRLGLAAYLGYQLWNRRSSHV